MGEDVGVRPAEEVELGPRPAGRRSRRRRAAARPSRSSKTSSFAFRACRCSTSEAAYSSCALRQRVGAPVRRLLLLREIDAEQFLHEVLEPVPVGVGARELGGDLGAVDRARHDAEARGSAPPDRSGRNGRS